MTTEHDAALTEQIAQALAGASYVEGPHAVTLFRDVATPILPIIHQAERDAARGALDGLAEFIRTDMDEPHGDRAASRVWGYRDTHYPEETP